MRPHLLALGVSAAAIGAQLLLAPLFHHSTYLLAAAALMAAVLAGGPAAALTATVTLALAGWALDLAAGIPLLERSARAALFLLVGGLVVVGAERTRRRLAGSAREAERRAEALHAQLTRIWSLNSMGEMATVLAHELNQPLSAVANYLRAARTLAARLELDDDDLLEAVSRAGDQAVRAGEIIRTLRELATRGGLEQKPESLADMIGEVDLLIRLMARDADVEVVCDLYRGDDVVMADRVQIQQLVVNLARNAVEALIKYPNRQLSINTRPDDSGNIVVSIEDSGPGIDPAVSERLFQPLSSTKAHGLGLGLSISSAIVENHRGRIWVEPSRLGGAAFRFVLARAGQHGDGVSRRPDGVRR